MKVLHLLQGIDPKLGGVTQAVKTIVKGLSLLSIDSEIIHFDTEYDSKMLDAKYIAHHFEAHNGWSYNAKLKGWLSENASRFDVIIVHGLWQYYSLAVYTSVLIKNKDALNAPKVFVMPHGMLDPYFQKAPGRKWKAVRNWIYWKIVEEKLINNSDGIIFTCETELILARQNFSPYYPKTEFISSLGIEEPPKVCDNMRDQFLQACPELGKSSYLLFLSRIQEKKGVDMLIRAYNNLLSSGEFGVVPKLVIAGPGIESEYGKSLLEFVKNSPQLKDSVLFPGMLSGDSKWGAFYNCEAFILPSHQENFGIAVVEALACGKPVLISDQVNIYKEIAKGQVGFIQKDTQAGTEKLLNKWISLSYDQKKEMGLKARQNYLEYYTVESAAASLLRAINY